MCVHVRPCVREEEEEEDVSETKWVLLHQAHPAPEAGGAMLSFYTGPVCANSAYSCNTVASTSAQPSAEHE
jgi:hypothetical protein